MAPLCRACLLVLFDISSPGLHRLTEMLHKLTDSDGLCLMQETELGNVNTFYLRVAKNMLSLKCIQFNQFSPSWSEAE